MKKERLTIGQMKDKYPNQWLFIINCEINENTTELVSGVVTVNSSSRHDVDKASSEYIGSAAIHFTGEIPEERLYLL